MIGVQLSQEINEEKVREMSQNNNISLCWCTMLLVDICGINDFDVRGKVSISVGF